MRPARATAFIALLLCAAPAVARADAEEASLHLEVGPVLHRVEDAAGYGQEGTIGGFRVSGRATYGLSNELALEAGAGGIVGAPAEFRVSDTRNDELTYKQGEYALRATVGVTLRLGVARILTLTALTGYQARLPRATALSDGGLPLVPEPQHRPRPAHDLIVGGGVGFDLRFGTRWVVGASLQAIDAVATSGMRFLAFEGVLHVANYFYPRLW